MNKESFLETLRTQYTEKIREVYFECEHNHQLDLAALSIRLKALMKTAKTEGLSHKEFEDLLKSVLPATLAGRIDSLINPAAKKVA